MDSRVLTCVTALAAVLATPSAALAATTVDVVTEQRGNTAVTFIKVTGDNADSQAQVENVVLNGAPGIRVTIDGATTSTAACRGTATGVACPSNGVSRLEATLAGRDDVFDASRLSTIPVSVDGGSGSDALTGTPLDDELDGLGSGDTLDGGAGVDILRGDDGFNPSSAGDDIIFAGAGNDFVNPGRGSDIVSGGPGRDTAIQIFGTVTLGDLLCNDGRDGDAPAFSRPPPPSRVATAPEGRLECAGDPSARDLLAGIEALSSGSTSEPVDFTGGPVDESLTGTSLADRLEGGGGVDSLFGFGGADLLLARDGVVDGQLRCSGTGVPAPGSRAVVDLNDVVQPDCETIQRGSAGTPGPVGGGSPSPIATFPPPSPPQGNQPSSTKEGTGPGGGGDPNLAPQVELPDKTASISRSGKLTLRVRCVYRAKDCVGTLSLSAGEKLGSGRNKISKGDSLGRASVKVPWGKSKPTVFKAPSKLREALAATKGKKTLKLKVRVVVKDGAAGKKGKSATAKRKIKLGLVAGKAKTVKPVKR